MLDGLVLARGGEDSGNDASGSMTFVFKLPHPVICSQALDSGNLSLHSRNISTALANPQLCVEYVTWLLARARHGDASFALSNGARVGNFVNFSEYHSMLGCISPAEQRFFLERVAVTPGTIIDIGANIGIVSVLLGHQFPDRTIHAIEPAPHTFAALGKNIALNRLGNVRAHQYAIADQPGSLALNADPTQRATARIATGNDTHIQTVEAITLDSLIEREAITDLALLKIDVEGFESTVFDGARRMLADRLAKIIFMEVCPAVTVSAGFDAAAPARIVQQAGYSWFRLEQSGALVAVEPAQAADVTLENWVALPL